MIPFLWQPGNSYFHKLHPLAKLLAFISIIILLMSNSWIINLIILCLLLFVHLKSGNSLRISGRTVVLFLILAALIFYGEYRKNDLNSGALFCARFLLTLYCALIFTSVTNPDSLGETFYIITKRIPFFPAGTLMHLISFSLSFIPMIEKEASDLKLALKSRCIDNRLSPLSRMYYISVPLITSVILKSNDIAEALFSRNISRNPTTVTLNPGRKDIPVFILSAIFITIRFLFL